MYYISPPAFDPASLEPDLSPELVSESMEELENTLSVLESVRGLSSQTDVNLRFYMQYGTDDVTGREFWDVSFPLSVKFRREEGGAVYAGDGTFMMNLDAMHARNIALYDALRELKE